MGPSTTFKILGTAIWRSGYSGRPGSRPKDPMCGNGVRRCTGFDFPRHLQYDVVISSRTGTRRSTPTAFDGPSIQDAGSTAVLKSFRLSWGPLDSILTHAGAAGCAPHSAGHPSLSGANSQRLGLDLLLLCGLSTDAQQLFRKAAFLDGRRVPPPSLARWNRRSAAARIGSCF